VYQLVQLTVLVATNIISPYTPLHHVISPIEKLLTLSPDNPKPESGSRLKQYS